VLISDISSVATDFLYTERPVLTCNPQGMAQAHFVAEFPTQASSYLIGPNLEGLEQALELAFGEDPLAVARLAMKKHVLGDTPDGPQAAFEAHVARVTAAN
jgi:CDP-glycerol glycerophosphotransferase (TagB/SpsB family)